MRQTHNCSRQPDRMHVAVAVARLEHVRALAEKAVREGDRGSHEESALMGLPSKPSRDVRWL